MFASKLDLQDGVAIVTREVDGVTCEPYEQLVVDVHEDHQGVIMQHMADRKAELKNMGSLGSARVKLEYIIPTRGLIGFHARFLTLTSGSGIIYHVFDHYAPVKTGDIISRHRGVLISNAVGKATGFALWNLQERGEMFN